MKISFMFVVALSFASVGCKKKGADGNDCAKAISNSMALSKAEMEKAPGMDPTMMQKMADLGVQHCKDDKWSADAIKCMTDAKSMTDAQGCYGKLTQDQQDKMNKAAMEMAMGPHGGGSAGSASGSAGSAAGSDGAAAGSGSAAAGSGETGSGSAGSAAAPK
jgi:hypothetical protein